MAVQTPVLSLPRAPAAIGRLAPGVALCGAISAVAYGLQSIEQAWLGHPFVEALVLAILIGTAVRTCWRPDAAFAPGIAFSAKQMLELAVALLGLSLSGSALAAAGLPLLAGIAGIVALSLAASYALGRALGLSHVMALLIACGNSICGNSAIAAVASAIEAEGDDVAASIAFTAVLGLIVVLTLPLAVPLLGLSPVGYGALAGLTVYAVPQVLAATVPVGTLAVQLGTLVKLVRVVCLGPVVVLAALTTRRAAPAGERAARLPLSRLVPPFVVAFVVLSLLRSLGAVPSALIAPVAQITGVLTVLAMAALGLGVDLRTLRRLGGRVTVVVTLSVVTLATLSFGLIRLLGL